jgi:hypothetical protein
LCEFGPTHNKEQVWLRLIRSHDYLWTTPGSAIIGFFIDWPIGLRDFNYWLQGGNLAQLKQLHDGIEAWASAQGANRITGLGRDGWLRAMQGNWQKGPTTRIKWLKMPRPSSSAT